MKEATKVNLIYAKTLEGVMGKDGKLPWHIPSDLKRFKELTLNHIVLMGRKTWESLPIKPLPNRNNFVLTTNPSYKADGAVVQTSTDFIMDIDDEVWVIGGAGVLRSMMPFAKTVEMTVIHTKSIKGDTIAPSLNYSMWYKDYDSGLKEENGYSFSFLTYKRKY